MAEDYYKLLDVAKNASKDEIKKAFRKLAMKYHPDKTKGDKGLEEKFKKINEAYAVLSNDEKRKQYDMFGAEGFSKRFSQEDIFRGFDLSGIFKEFGFGNRSGGFSSFFNGGGRPGGRGNREPGGPGGPGNPFGGHHHSPRSAETELRIDLVEAVLGAKKRVSLDTGSGYETLDIAIPRGIDDGQKLRLKGKGPMDPMLGQRGDLHVNISIIPHPVFQRKGSDLIVEQGVKLTDMVLGGTIRVATIDDQQIDLKVPPNFKNNGMLRIRGKGIPGKNGKPDGSLLVRLQVKLPTQLTEVQQKLFQDLSETGI